MMVQKSNFDLPFMQLIFPSTEEILSDKDRVRHRNCVIWGSQESGKSTTATTLVENLRSYYGTENVYDVWTVDSLNVIFEGMKSKLVNVLVADDMTMQEHSEEDLRKFFRVRHIYQESTGRTCGLVVTVMIAHGFYELVKPVRLTANLILAKSVPTNNYDRSEMVKWWGQELLNEFVEKKLEKDSEGWTLWYVSDKHKGMIYIPKTHSPLNLIIHETPRRVLPVKPTPLSVPNYPLPTCTCEPTPEPETVDLPINVKLRMLRVINEGERKNKPIADLSRDKDMNYGWMSPNKKMWRGLTAQALRQMEQGELIKWGGILFKGWRLTDKGKVMLLTRRKKRRGK